MRVLAIVVALAGCTQVKTEFVCATDADCATESGAAGRCEVVGRCSFADTSCEGGFRYGDEAGVAADRCATVDDCIAEVRAGVASTCVRNSDGTVSCWGDGSSEPVQIDVPAGTIAQLDNAGAGLCVRYDDGRLSCRSGAVAGDYAIAARAVAVGTTHACAIIADGHVQCWGENTNGQLGDNTQNRHDDPENVTGLADVGQLASGLLTSCAITSSGEVLCWGDDHQGQIGRGPTISEESSVPLHADVNAQFAELAVGDLFTCGVARDGALWCWGDNSYGQNAQGFATGEADSPVLVESLSSVSQITAGGDHACALRSDGQAFCWGSNSSHEAAASSADKIVRPTLVVDAGGAAVRFHDITAGAQHTCGRTADKGAVVCWGDNTHGQLGLAASGVVLHPAPVPLVCH